MKPFESIQDDIDKFTKEIIDDILYGVNRQTVLSINVGLRYDKAIPNSTSAPKSGVVNKYRSPSSVLNYCGFVGQINYKLNKSITLIKDPITVNTKESRIHHTHLINWDNAGLLEYTIRIFISDFPWFEKVVDKAISEDEIMATLSGCKPNQLKINYKWSAT